MHHHQPDADHGFPAIANRVRTNRGVAGGFAGLEAVGFCAGSNIQSARLHHQRVPLKLPSQRNRAQDAQFAQANGAALPQARGLE